MQRNIYQYIVRAPGSTVSESGSTASESDKRHRESKLPA